MHFDDVDPEVPLEVYLFASDPDSVDDQIGQVILFPFPSPPSPCPKHYHGGDTGLRK